MDLWHSIDQSASGVVLYPFQPVDSSSEQSHFLRCKPGDVVVLTQQCRSWYYGYLIGCRGDATGIIPKSFVHLKNSHYAQRASSQKNFSVVSNRFKDALQRIFDLFRANSCEVFKSGLDLLKVLLGTYKCVLVEDRHLFQNAPQKIEFVEKFDSLCALLNLDIDIRNYDCDPIDTDKLEIFQLFEHYKGNRLFRSAKQDQVEKVDNEEAEQSQAATTKSQNNLTGSNEGFETAELARNPTFSYLLSCGLNPNFTIDNTVMSKIPNVYVEIFKPDISLPSTYEFSWSICTLTSPVEYISDIGCFLLKNNVIYGPNSTTSVANAPNNSLNMPFSAANNLSVGTIKRSVSSVKNMLGATNTTSVLQNIDGNSFAFLFPQLRSSDVFRNLALICKVYRRGKIPNDKKDHHGNRLTCAGIVQFGHLAEKADHVPFKTVMNMFAVPTDQYREMEEFLLSRAQKTNLFQMEISIIIRHGTISMLKRDYPSWFRSVVTTDETAQPQNNSNSSTAPNSPVAQPCMSQVNNLQNGSYFSIIRPAYFPDLVVPDEMKNLLKDIYTKNKENNLNIASAIPLLIGGHAAHSYINDSYSSRCDLYVQLVEAYLDKHPKGGKLNLEIGVNVVTSSGQILNNCIFEYDNQPDNAGLAEYQSIVSLHSNNPVFYHGFRVSLTPEQLQDVHLRLVLTHISTTSGGPDTSRSILEQDAPTQSTGGSSESSYSFTVLRLKDNDCIVNDGQHKLVCYKMDNKADFRRVKEYLKWGFSENPQVVGGTLLAKDYLLVNTRLVSSKLTTNPNMQALRRFQKKFDPSMFKTTIENLMYTNDSEKMFFFNEMVFGIAHICEKYEDKKQLDFDKPLYIMLNCLSLIFDKRYSHFYYAFIKGLENMKAPTLYNTIYDTLIEKFNDINSKNNRETIKQFLKALPLVVSLMTKSAENAEEKRKSLGVVINTESENINVLMIRLLEKLFETLASSKDQMFVLKVELINSLPQILIECRSIFSLDDLIRLIKSAISHLFNFLLSTEETLAMNEAQTNSLIKFGEKLICQLISMDYFMEKSYREQIFPFFAEVLEAFSRHLNSYFIMIRPLCRVVSFIERNELKNANFMVEENLKVTILAVMNMICKLLENEIETLFLSSKIKAGREDDLDENTKKDRKNTKRVASTVRDRANTIMSGDATSKKLNLLALVVATFQLISKEDFMEYWCDKTQEQMNRFILVVLKFFDSVLINQVINEKCFTLYIVCLSTFVKIVYFSYLLLTDQQQGDEMNFNKRLSQMFIKFSLRFIRCSWLQLEQFNGAKRELTLNKYGDMRIKMLKILSLYWKKLNKNRVHFYKSFISQLTSITMIDNSELMNLSLNTLFESVQFEALETDPKLSNLNLVESLIISSLDDRIGACQDFDTYIYHFEKIGGEYLKTIEKQLKNLSDPSSSVNSKRISLENAKRDLTDSNENVIQKINEIMKRRTSDNEESANMNVVKTLDNCVERYQQTYIILANTLTQLCQFNLNKDDERSYILKEVCDYKLANFYKSINRMDLYQRSLVRMKNRQLAVGNNVEAGFALIKHAKTYLWSTLTCTAAPNDSMPEQLEWVRREKLYKEALKHLSEGKCYESCIKLCKELIVVYESRFYLYEQAAEALKLLSQYYSAIVNDELRFDPEYFWVGFYGMKFHSAVRNQEFIYRGANFLRLGDLLQKLRSNFPQAEVIGQSKKVDPSVKNSNKMIICCTGVSAHPDIDNNTILKSDFSDDKIKNYYMKNNVRVFMRQRPLKNTEEVLEKWVEQIEFTTEFKFPGFSEWSVIVNSQSKMLQPIQVALNDVRKKVEILKSMITKMHKDAGYKVTELSSLLNGIIDSVVNGGMGKYCEAFLCEAFAKQNKDSLEHVENLRFALADVVNTSRMGMIIHEMRVEQSLYGLHAKLVEMFETMRISIQGATDIELEPFESVSENFISSGYADSAQQQQPQQPVSRMAKNPSMISDQTVSSLNANSSSPPTVPSGGVSQTKKPEPPRKATTAASFNSNTESIKTSGAQTNSSSHVGSNEGRKLKRKYTNDSGNAESSETTVSGSKGKPAAAKNAASSKFESAVNEVTKKNIAARSASKGGDSFDMNQPLMSELAKKTKAIMNNSNSTVSSAASDKGGTPPLTSKGKAPPVPKKK